MRNDKVWLATMFAAVALAGCGDDGDGGSVSASKNVGELSASEQQSFCSEVDEKLARVQKSLISVVCTEEARTDSATCKAERAACIKNPPVELKVEDKVDFECGGDDDSLSHVCADITVGELRGCVNALIDMIESVAEQYDCSTDLNDLDPPQFPEQCKKLGDRCETLSGISFD